MIGPGTTIPLVMRSKRDRRVFIITGFGLYMVRLALYLGVQAGIISTIAQISRCSWGESAGFAALAIVLYDKLVSRGTK